MFVLDEIYVRGPKIIHNHIRVGNTLAKFPKDKPRVLKEGLMGEPKFVKLVQPTEGSRHPVGNGRRLKLKRGRLFSIWASH